MPGRSGTPRMVIFASEVSWVTPEIIAFSSMPLSSSQIHVPGVSENVERTCRVTP